MVLLDLIVRQRRYEVAVAHVDHGIRQESSDDEEFVEAQARRYGVPYVSKRFELGEQASEDLARLSRYDFLLDEAHKRDSVLATGHHRDDLIGSVAINLIRGTGWRGLAVMNRPGIIRPLLSMTKQQIYQYAVNHRLEWVEDASNQTDRYLRNRLRANVLLLPTETQGSISSLRNRQVQLVEQIAFELEELSSASSGSRHYFTMIETRLAQELLRYQIDKQCNRLLQPEQISRAVVAIKTAKPGTNHDVGDGVWLKFSCDRFIVDSHL